MNVINGGSHADNSLDFREFMLVPLQGVECLDAVAERLGEGRRAVRDRNHCRDRDVPLGRVALRDLTLFRRDRGHFHRRLCRGYGRRRDQDRLVALPQRARWPNTIALSRSSESLTRRLCSIVPL